MSARNRIERHALSGFGAAAMLSLGALALGQAGCNTEAYCYDCNAASTASSTTSTGEGGEGGGGFMTSATGFSTGSGNCDAETLTDPENCGFCGNVCNIANAFPKCEGGFCLIDSCAPGWLDLDEQVVTGCEYQCTPSNNGVEICDGLDNDCNGLVDETFDTDNDTSNCGACNHVCSYSNAIPGCATGTCFMQQCLVGYHDTNSSDVDGCEYQCTETNGGVEVCDLADNNCDGNVDEGIDTATDSHNCGQCGTDCTSLYPHASGACQASACMFSACDADYYDIDGNSVNGCEYHCAPANPGAEVCDGVDNDCNGVVDDGVLPGVGDPCGTSNVGECQLGAQHCVAGGLVCQNAILPDTEYCDGLDNDCNGTVDNGCPSALTSDIRLDIGTNSAVGQATSTQLNTTSLGNVVFAAWLDRRAGNADIRGNVSVNGGVTWQTPSDIAIATGSAGQVEPSVALSPTGAYVAFGEFSGAVRQIKVTHSTTSPFTTFPTAVRADHQATDVDSFFPRLVVANPSSGSDDIVLVWQSISGSGTNVLTNVYLQRSLDGGVTWLANDLRVNSILGTAEIPALATDGNGHAYIAWRDQRFSDSEVYFDVYDVAAGTLSGNQALSASHAADDIRVTAPAGGARVYVAWTDLRGTKSAIRVNGSSNNGASFGTDGKIVNPDSTFADASTPDIVASGNRAFVAWEDTRSGKKDIRINATANGGTTWLSSTARADLGDTAGSSDSFEPKLAFGSASELYVTWQDRRNGRGDIYINRSFDLGITFQPDDIRLDVGQTGALSPLGGADSRAPFVCATNSGDRASVVWIDSRTAAGSNGAFSDIYTNYIQ